jgi:hypothetical protein
MHSTKTIPGQSSHLSDGFWDRYAPSAFPRRHLCVRPYPTCAVCLGYAPPLYALLRCAPAGRCAALDARAHPRKAGTPGGRAAGGRCEKGFCISYPFTTGTYEAVKAELEQHGVEVSGRPENSHCIYFHDPDGHRLQRMVQA